MKKRALLCLLALMLCLPMTTMAVDASEAYSSPVDIAADMLIQLDRDSFSTAATLEDKHSVAYEAAYLLADVGALDETSWSEVLVKINELTGGEPLPLAEYLCQNEGILDDVRLIEAVAFSDIADDAWYADYVNTAAYLGLVNGRGDGLFMPDGTMTYAEAVTLYEKALALSPRPRFTDPVNAIAQLYEIQGQYEKAVEFYQKEIEIVRQDWNETQGEAIDEPLRNIARLKEKMAK